MRRLTSLGLGALLLLGMLAGADPASAAKKPDFRYPTNAELGLPAPGGQNTAKDDTDPFDPGNDVVSFDNDPATGAGGEFVVGAVETVLGRKGKGIRTFENQLDVSYLFIGRTCSAGSPRLQLAIDEDRDGTYEPGVDGNVFGYLGNTEGGATGQCGENSWVTEDMTNSVAKWDASQIEDGTQVSTWNEVEQIVGRMRVMKISLVDDSASFAPDTSGCAYFDRLKIGENKLKRARDTQGTGGESAALNDC